MSDLVGDKTDVAALVAYAQSLEVERDKWQTHATHATHVAHEAADEIERLQQRVESFEADSEFHKAQAAKIRRLEDQCRDIRAETIEECAKPLEQIMQVCADNAGEGSNHKMALDFVHQISIRALKERK